MPQICIRVVEQQVQWHNHLASPRVHSITSSRRGDFILGLLEQVAERDELESELVGRFIVMPRYSPKGLE